MSKWLQDRSVLVTGGGSGIGAAAARRFAQEGASVVVADRDEASARRIADIIGQSGGRALGVQADISIENDNDKMVDAVVTAFGRLDIALLNAGVHNGQGHVATPGFEEGDLALFDRTLAVNLRGTYLGLRSVYRKIEPGGSVICTASLAGVYGYPDDPSYSAAKHGVVSLVKSFAHGFSKKRARVNGICPGGVITPMIGAQQDDALVDPDELSIPAFGAICSAQHIAEWAIFLASPRSSTMNGAVVELDNGLMRILPMPNGQ